MQLRRLLAVILLLQGTTFWLAAADASKGGYSDPLTSSASFFRRRPLPLSSLRAPWGLWAWCQRHSLSIGGRTGCMGTFTSSKASDRLRCTEGLSLQAKALWASTQLRASESPKTPARQASFLKQARTSSLRHRRSQHGRATHPPSVRNSHRPKFSWVRSGQVEAEPRSLELQSPPPLLPKDVGVPTGKIPEAINATMAALGFYRPIGAQAQCLGLAATGSDLVLNSPTGSGKALSLLLPLLQWHAARSAAVSSSARKSSGASSMSVKDEVATQRGLPFAAGAVSPVAVSAAARAQAVSIILAPTGNLALQLLTNLRAAALAWLQAASKAQQEDRGRQMPQGPLPRLLLLNGGAADEDTSRPLSGFASLKALPCESVHAIRLPSLKAQLQLSCLKN